MTGQRDNAIPHDIEREIARIEQEIRALRERLVALRGGPLGRPSLNDLRHSGMTVREVALVLSLTEEQVRRKLRRGDLVGVSFGGRVGWRLPRDYVRDVATRWANAPKSIRRRRT
jgi:hypothetical protein